MKELNGTIRIITFGDVLIIPYTIVHTAPGTPTIPVSVSW